MDELLTDEVMYANRPSEIVDMLRNIYTNLDAPSPRQVKKKPKMPFRRVSSVQQAILRDSPKLVCICERGKNFYHCENCRKSMHGRAAQVCPVHPSVFFLMDFRGCPYCADVIIADKTDEQPDDGAI
ncbi:uncharacterized protein CG13380-like [Drosophila obscura]|uniref:uncharacterized protein CG13380-like n=1 Tax=Drosophila obscura TaxID=7282 RepID=UPI000BA11F8F|nr:uncharacterized protein CG13380-like [Drosophila obscura]